MEPLDLQIHFFTILGQQRREFVNSGLRGQSIVGRRVVDLLALPLDPAEFLLECSGSISELRVMLIELGVVPPEACHTQTF
jgi:hypothetical protein